MRSLTLFVDGMRCPRCVREVTARLRDVPGVRTVSADARRSTVRLGGTMTADDVLRAFAELPYQPRLLDEPPTGH